MNPRDDTSARAAATIRLHFLFEALRLQLLPSSLAPAVSRLAAAVEEGSGCLAPVPRDLAALCAEQWPDLGLPDFDWDSLASGGPPAAEALTRVRGETSPRAAAERLGRFCEALVAARQGRRMSGSYYTPQWIADHAGAAVLGGLLAGRGWRAEQALSLRILDPAVGAGAFAVAAMEAIADSAGEGREENDLRRAAVKQCLFGIDLDPLALASCRLALWLAASRPGRPAAVPAEHFTTADALAPRPPREFDVVLANPPWGVKLARARAARLARVAPEALSGHRDSYLFFLQLAADSVRDDGGFGLLLPDTVLVQTRYEGMRRALLARFRPLRVVLLGDRIFTGAAAPACLLCCLGRAVAPDRFSTVDVRRVPRAEMREAAVAPGAMAPREAPMHAPHHSILIAPLWLTGLLDRLTPRLPGLGDPDRGFALHDTGINYGTAAAGRAILYQGAQEDARDTPVTRGRDFGPLSPIGHSLWLRHDWPRRVGASDRVGVREPIYRIAPKVLLRQTGDRPVATLDRQGAWFGRSVIALTGAPPERLLFLAALLNSRPVAALYRALVPEVGRSFAQVKVGKLKLLPLPSGGDCGIARLAERMLSETDPPARRRIMDEIDAAVYRAYGLRGEEVRRIEELVPSALAPRSGAVAARSKRAARGATP